jgi:serine/threonine-protein kinase HipA
VTDTRVLVHVDLDGIPVPAGRLWARERRGRESASFEYDPRWLTHPARFALEPALTLGPGPFHTPAGRSLFGALGDSAPDRRGRVLMRRAERRRAERAGETPRTLREIDNLLRVDNEARQGALRLSEVEGGPFLATAEASRIPPLIELPRLLSAAENVIDDTDTDEDLRVLSLPGEARGRERGSQPSDVAELDRTGRAGLNEDRRRSRKDAPGSSAR